MKYTMEERMEIGRQVYEGEHSKCSAAKKYDVNPSTIKDYVRLYRAANDLPPKVQQYSESCKVAYETAAVRVKSEFEDEKEIDKLRGMTKEELIREIVNLRVNEARLKKGYEVKGAGVQKVFVPLGGKNTK